MLKGGSAVIYELVEVSSIIIFSLSALLSIVLTKNYLGKRKTSMAMWAAGLWMFSVSAALEAAFAAGIFSETLIDLYLFLVAFLVEILALGSVFLSGNKLSGTGYLIYVLATALFLAYSFSVSTVGNIIVGGVVYGEIPPIVIISSSLATFPAALILVISSIKSYRKTRDSKLLSIVAGVILVSIAGTLYIASFPALLYYAEFGGILLLWFGFLDFSRLTGEETDSKEAKANVSS